MKKSSIVIRCLLLMVLGFFSMSSWSACSIAQKADLAKAGYQRDEIEKMCAQVSAADVGGRPAETTSFTASPNTVPEKNAQQKNLVRVYFINPEGGFNDALIMYGEKVLARTQKGQFHFVDIPPGRHTFYVTTWSKILKSSIDVDASSGNDAYLLVKANIGAGLASILAGPFVAGATAGGPYLFESVSPDEGKKLLQGDFTFVSEASN